MVRIEYGRFGDKLRSARRAAKPRQEICASLKWLSFLLNCLVFVVGVVVLVLGVYSYVKDPRAIASPEDVILNASIVIGLAGLLVSLISITGLFGSLREHCLLLKISIWLSTMSFITIVVLTFGAFAIFYSDLNENVYVDGVLSYAIRRYHLNGNVADMMDYLQETMECCGIRSPAQGYRDWQLNDQFVCNDTNPFPERCGVPFSCCRKAMVVDGSVSGSVVAPGRSLKCWQDALKRRPHELEADIHVRGCLVPLKQTFERNALIVASVFALVLIVGCLYVFMEYILARQIEFQHYLLDREVRRAERRRRREQRRLEKAQKTGQPRAEPSRKTSKLSQHSSHNLNRVRKRSQPPQAVDPQDRVAQWVRQQSDLAH